MAVHPKDQKYLGRLYGLLWTYLTNRRQRRQLSRLQSELVHQPIAWQECLGRKTKKFSTHSETGMLNFQALGAPRIQLMTGWKVMICNSMPTLVFQLLSPDRHRCEIRFPEAEDLFLEQLAGDGGTAAPRKRGFDARYLIFSASPHIVFYNRKPNTASV